MSKLFLQPKNKWEFRQKGDSNLYFRGDLSELVIEKLLDSSITKKKLSQIPIKIYENFLFILSNKNFHAIVSDRIRSYAICFSSKNKVWHIGDHISELSQSLKPLKINNSSLLSFSMSGYVLGNNTLYKNIFSIEASQIIFLDDHGKFQSLSYCKHYYLNTLDYSYEELQRTLEEKILHIFSRLVKKCGNRQIVVPLSAGYDSRLVVSTLHKLGYKNVKCYSYGFYGDFESSTSKKIAKKLGYDWKFIPMNSLRELIFYRSKEFKSYLNFADNIVSTPVLRWLSTIKYLKESGWIDKDAIFVNGNSGDFISGGHLPEEIISNSQFDQNASLERVISLTIEKHFSLWNKLKNCDNLSLIRADIKKEIQKKFSDSNFKNESRIFESLEFYNRQSKYVINTQRIYEFYGFDWYLPLWDKEFINFWERVPEKYKLGQKLYKETLRGLNYGDVWKIPLNKPNIRPYWIILPRFLAKISFRFLPNGREKWKKFDKIFFQYWMDNGMVTKAHSYFDYIKLKDRKNILSITSRNYLKAKIYNNDY